jgi:hypothetical protein
MSRQIVMNMFVCFTDKMIYGDMQANGMPDPGINGAFPPKESVDKEMPESMQ